MFPTCPNRSDCPLTKAIRIDPLNKVAYNYLAYACDMVGDIEKSDWATERYMVMAPDETNPCDTRDDLYAGRVRRFNQKRTGDSQD